MTDAELQEIQVYLDDIKSERLPSVSSTGNASTTTSTSSNTTSSPSPKGKKPLSVINYSVYFPLNVYHL